MTQTDEHNLVLVRTAEAVDEINATFYGRFPYPWSAAKFEFFHDADFNTVMISQDVGDWGHTRMPRAPAVWVAGCGTNQAVITALKFPAGTVIGSDVSATSLEMSGQAAKQIGLTNLGLRRESINEVGYHEQFDYLICTGVIHHNADPAATLGKLARALKPNGILELMVYNRFHWLIPVAFQQAVRILGGDAQTPDFENELAITRRLIDTLPKDTFVGSYLRQFANYPETQLADTLLQPVMYSYTVESLEQMAAGCGLEILAPCISPFDKIVERNSWNLEWADKHVRDLYEALPDLRRWQVTNLLTLESSPMLWFYLQRKDSVYPRKDEKQVCQEFLDTRFERACTTQGSYTRGTEGGYRLAATPVAFPNFPPDPRVRRVFEMIDGRMTMREVFQRQRLPTDFNTVNQARILLTTSAYPYLKAIESAD